MEQPVRVYYLKSTGEQLCIVSGIKNDEENINENDSYINKDVQIYPQLKDKTLDEIDYIEVPIDDAYTKLNNYKSLKINSETKELNIIYYTQEELKSIEEEIKGSSLRVVDITTYLSNSDETTITDIENSIIETEKNKIINGGM